MTYRIGDVRRYVYEQIRRMLRIGWLVHDEERRVRGTGLPPPIHPDTSAARVD